MAIERITARLKQNTSIAPLVVFRIAFGALMFISLIRFILKGWVYNMYILPKMYFPYYGFEWVKPFGAAGMYVVFGLLLLCSLAILCGLFYRLSAILFFLLFTYVELIDKTNYLNHYYFISLISFLLIFVPAGKSFSLDNRLFKRAEQEQVPCYFVLILQLQMFVVYFFAGIAKLNYAWLVEAQPLRTWLPAFSHFHIIGDVMEKAWVAYLFSWFSCVYDLFIGFFLFNKRSSAIAYVFVLVFHLATSLFFNIGMFPYIMITITIIFLSGQLQQRIVAALKSLVGYRNNSSDLAVSVAGRRAFAVFFAGYFLVQVLVPFRYVLYPGNLFWTEQGYRFSWRVMLMEKAGTAFFYVRDSATGRETEVDNKEYLTYMQEKMMATQPDMMVDYAKFLKAEFEKKGLKEPQVRAQSYVTLNGCGSREFIDPAVDLSRESNSVFKNKGWVKSY